ncbi:RidA family protein (plasmid) [Bradyrhizobium septentrionale]|uniref:RidA family protein n=1 Tax=Bradyrhizobium septentrionale TaxID=1404411 RepID=A0A974A743_9BRAD|nr:RidA family protein [Bradyrhizobium septentrionale]UGY11979.1 RidA family protein [Bradyrhizobium septentrionale]UGY30182.1 RidA family protein [Bradyrhizobium septentrionale]
MKEFAGFVAFCLVILASAFEGAQAENSSSAEARLREKNITLPAEAAPVGSYVNAVQVGNLLFMAGSVASEPKGKLGRDLTVEQGYEAPRQAGLITLAKVRAALGSLDRKRVVKVVGMVNSVDDFDDQAKVFNGYCDLMIEVFGESIGRHARSSLGVAALPRHAAVEVEMILEV